jgi:L-cysteine S-thiosulfotransferase
MPDRKLSSALRYSLQVLVTLFMIASGTVAMSAESAAHVPRSGIEYASVDIRAMQADDFSNPGMLWVSRGEMLWNKPGGVGGKSCATCHQQALQTMRGVATRYPRMDKLVGRLFNLEGRINTCREQHQAVPALTYESEDLLALTAYVAYQSRGLPMAIMIDDENRTRFESGRQTYIRRQGQMNLACNHCHDRNAGRRLLAEVISEGHSNAYPAYRLEWQGLGSLHRRLRACYFGVRAERPEFGSNELLDLELYLARRATGLPVETPGVRR